MNRVIYTEADRLRIASTPGSEREVGAAHGVAATTIAHWRRKFNLASSKPTNSKIDREGYRTLTLAEAIAEQARDK